MHEYQFAGRFFTCLRIRLRLSKYISIKTKALLQTDIHTFGTLTYYIENVFYIQEQTPTLLFHFLFLFLQV